MKKLSSVVSILLLSGCATINPHTTFEKIKQTVNERTGHKVVWNDSSPESLEVKTHIDEVLRGKLTLNDAIEVSLLNNKSLQAEYADLGIAQAELVQAGLLSNPTFMLERRFKGRAFEADIAQDFLSLFLIPLKKKAAKAELESVTNRITQTVLDHVFELKSAYYSFQAEQQEVEMRESVVSALGASYKTSLDLRNAGNTSLLETQNEASMLAQAKLELEDAEVKVIDERERLNILLGAWGENTSWMIDKRLPDLPAKELESSGLESYAIAHRMDLLSAKNELQSTAVQVGIANYQAIIPELSITGHFERETDGTSSKGPSVTLPIPLFNWGQAASVQGQALFDQQRKRYEAKAIEIRSKVRRAYVHMSAARAKAEFYFNEVLPLQKKTLEQSQLFYNGMFIGVFQLLQVKQAQINAGQLYLETLKSYWLARTELERELGGSLEDIVTTEQLLTHAKPQSSTTTSFQNKDHRN